MELVKDKIYHEKETGLAWLCLGEDEMPRETGVVLALPQFKENSKRPLRFDVYLTPKENLEIEGNETISIKDKKQGFSFVESPVDCFGIINPTYDEISGRYKKAIKHYEQTP